MAVEIKQHPKRLYRHAVPLTMLVVGVMALVVLSVSQTNDTTNTAARSLVRPIVRVEPSPNGLSKVTLNQADKALPYSHLQELGRSTSLTFSFQ